VDGVGRAARLGRRRNIGHLRPGRRSQAREAAHRAR
jgi:hypothetical protein